MDFRPGLTCALEVEADVFECPHHELQLQQEGEDPAVLVQAALGDNNVEGPVNLFRKPHLVRAAVGHTSPIHSGQGTADLVPELQAAQHIRGIRGKHFRQVFEGKRQVGSMWGIPMEAILQRLAQDAVKDQWVEQLSRCLSSP